MWWHFLLLLSLFVLSSDTYGGPEVTEAPTEAPTEATTEAPTGAARVQLKAPLRRMVVRRH
jgi:hypothetical protein